MTEGVLKWVSELVERLVPESQIGDRIVAYKRFVRIHKRVPRRVLQFNDVLFRLKISKEIDDPLRVFVSDKEFVKLYIAAIVGPQYNIPTLKILRTIEEVEEFSFPLDCCIKPTHASGQVLFRRGGEEVDKRKIQQWFEINYYRKTRERNYKTLKPKVIVEPLLFGQSDLTDFRFFCYRGKVKLIALDIGKYSGYRRAFYNPKWEQLPFSLHYPISTTYVNKPERLDEMTHIAQKLSEGFEFVRVDMFSSGTEFYVGELTNCHASAGQQFVPPSAERLASRLLFDVDAEQEVIAGESTR